MQVVENASYEDLITLIDDANHPIVFKGFVNNWSLVAAGKRSSENAIAFLKKFYNGKMASASVGLPEVNGRLFYNDDFTVLNFEQLPMRIDQLFDNILFHANDDMPPTFYIGSASLNGYFPGLRSDNNLDCLFRNPKMNSHDLLESIWIGNRTTASCHYDAPYNIACCVVGNRRFTLFPPSQVTNLYPGPLNLTPGGQAVSLVDFSAPDFQRYPKFADALMHAQRAELEAGDLIYIPSMWWHHVEALSDVNVLVNYWWSKTPVYFGSPMNALLAAIMSLRQRPENEKAAWQALFEFYVFGDTHNAVGHLPETAQGFLGNLSDLHARQLRMMLMNNLNR